MKRTSYLQWAIENTRTEWWHDSAEPGELELAMSRGSVGVTTNPFLSNLALSANRDAWTEEIDAALSENAEPERKAENLMSVAITHAARRLEPQYEKSAGRMGYVCAQVNPARAADRECMLAMARRFHAWAPNIAIKLPATAAGLDALEDCTAEGITATLTVSFTAPQVIAIAERHRLGIRRAKQNGVEPGGRFAVIMIGRLDDYLREVARDSKRGHRRIGYSPGWSGRFQAGLFDLQATRLRSRVACRRPEGDIPHDGIGRRGCCHVDCSAASGNAAVGRIAPRRANRPRGADRCDRETLRAG